MKLRKLKDRIDGLWVKYYPITIQQGVFDAETDETLDVTLGKKATHGYPSSPKTLKEVEDDTSVKMENLVVNGDFRDDTHNPFMTHLGSAEYSGGNIILTITGDRFGILGQNIGTWSVGKKVYFKSRCRALDSGSTNLFVSLRDGIISGASISGFPNISNPVQNQWYDLSSVATGNSTSAIWVTNSSTYPSGEGTGKRFEVEYSYAIDLTATFGVGNEPTKEEMDLLISTLGIEYFEGEITIPAQKIMQWQLALIRKNKNAIIALGGTII